MTMTKSVPFVPPKEPDWSVVSALLAESRATNRFANFGPVSRRLEQAIIERLSVRAPETRAAVVCSSATTGLQAAAGALSIQAGRPLRWVVSAYGFFSTFIGVFSDALVIDCGLNGLIDQTALAALDPADYDGVVVTNPFGLVEDFSTVCRFCADRGKAMILDNAAGFGLIDGAVAPQERLDWAEVVSFHHTKPFGFGEGGAVILAPDLAERVRSVINFGVGLADEVTWAPYLCNGKMAEYPAALILDRLLSVDRWQDGYRCQAQRVLELGRSVGLTPLLIPAGRAVPGQLAFLADRGRALVDLANPVLDLAKYYRPRHPAGRRAADLFARMVNVPTHPGMAALSDDSLRLVLAKAAGDSK